MGLIGTAGHVDHGKTSLIRALTGIETDRLPEEKTRGLTIDLGFAFVDLPEVGRYSIVDVPGHEKFISNMLVGVVGMDLVMLCIASDQGVMPQTKEHFEIIQLLPVQKLIVVLTRCDLAEPDMIEIVKEEVSELLAPTRFAESPVIETSAQKNLGIEELKKCLVSEIKEVQAKVGKAWYLPIDRVFIQPGHGTVVTGTLAGSDIQAQTQGELLPHKREVNIRSIHSHGEKLETGKRGTRVALNLGKVKAEEIERGHVVAFPGACQTTSLFDGSCHWLRKPRHAQRVRISLGADEVIGKVFLNDFDEELVQMRLERETVATKDQPFVIRNYSPPLVLGGGTVQVVKADKRRKNEKPQEKLEGSLIDVVNQMPSGGMTEEIAKVMSVSSRSLSQDFENAKHEGSLLGFAGLWFTPSSFEKAKKHFLETLLLLNQANPSLAFLPREKVVEQSKLPWQGKPLDRILSQLFQSAEIRMKGTMIAHTDHLVELNDKQRQFLDRVLKCMDEGGVNVSSPQELPKVLGVPPQAIEEILRVGIDAGEVMRINEQIFYSQTMLQEIKQKLIQTFSEKRFAASEFRSEFETSRKYAIPLLEYFDSRGVTLRQGDVRIIQKK